jgi:hypothetical protein
VICLYLYRPYYGRFLRLLFTMSSYLQLNLIAGYTGQFSLVHHASQRSELYSTLLVTLLTSNLDGYFGRPVSSTSWFHSGVLCLRMRDLSGDCHLPLQNPRLLHTYKITRGDLGLGVLRFFRNSAGCGPLPLSRFGCQLFLSSPSLIVQNGLLYSCHPQ